MLDCISQTCKTTFEGEQVSLMLVDREQEDLVVRSATGHESPERVLGQRAKIGHGIAGWVAEHRQPVSGTAGSPIR